jgi:hypothetical protein
MKYELPGRTEAQDKGEKFGPSDFPAHRELIHVVIIT